MAVIYRSKKGKHEIIDPIAYAKWCKLIDEKELVKFAVGRNDSNQVVVEFRDKSQLN